MPQNNPQGYGSFLGLGTEARDTMLRKKRQQGLEKFRSRMQEASKGMQTPADRTLFNMFAEVGAAIGSKINGSPAFGGELSPDEERVVAAAEQFNRRADELKSSDDYKNAPDDEKSYMMGKAMADAQWEAGDVPGYLQTMDALTQRRLQQRESEARTRTLEVEADVAEAKAPGAIRRAELALDDLESGKPTAFVPMVNGQPILESPEMLTLMPDGTLQNGAGETVSHDQYMMLEDGLRWGKVIAEHRPEDVKATSFAKAYFGQSAMTKLRDGLGRVSQMADIGEKVGEALVGATSPDNVVGMPGAVVGVANNLRATINAGAKLFVSRDEDGKVQGPGRSLEEAAQELIPDSAVPMDLRNDAARRAQYKSAVMEMLYVDAKMFEEGARQLSDADIARAADRLGIHDSDPAVVLHTFQRSMQDRMGQAKGKYERYANIMKRAGYDPSAAMQDTLGADALELIDMGTERMMKSLNSASDRAGPATDEQAAQGASPGTALNPDQEAALQGLGF